MTDATYGELVNHARVSLARAMTTAVDPSRTDDVLALASGLDAFRRAIRRHAEFAADPWRDNKRLNRPNKQSDKLAAALHPTWLPTDSAHDICPKPDSDWLHAARYLGAATDLLATHLGPDGRQLTADARRLVNADAHRQLQTDAAQFAGIVADHALHVARRVADEPHDDRVRAIIAGWFDHGGQVRSAAYRIIAPGATVGPHDELADLAPAPPLRPEPVADLHDSFRAFDRLRRLCHAQATGDLRVDVNVLRGFATLGYTVTGLAHVVHTAVAARAGALGLDCATGEHHQRAADRLRHANAAWGRLHATLADIRDAGGGPAGWQADILGVREQHDRLIRRDRHLLLPEELVPDMVTARSLLAASDQFTAGLGSIVAGQRDCVGRLYRAGQLHVPTRQLEAADIPRMYALIPPHRFDELLTAYEAVAATTRSPLDLPPDTGSHRPVCERTPTPAKPALLRRNEQPGPAATTPAITR